MKPWNHAWNPDNITPANPRVGRLGKTARAQAPPLRSPTRGKEAIPLWEIPRGWDVRVAQREVVRPRPAHAAPHTTLSDRGGDEKNVTYG